MRLSSAGLHTFFGGILANKWSPGRPALETRLHRHLRTKFVRVACWQGKLQVSEFHLRLSWLEYFVEGLVTQLSEVKERREKAVRRDVLVKEHRLSDRHAEVLAYVLEQGNLSLREFENLFPEVNRRSLQRDLKAMVDRGLLVSEGATNKLTCRIRDTG
jgi:predicted HTH transcriptional regulator